MKLRETTKQKHREACDRVQSLKVQIADLSDELEQARDKREELEAEVLSVEADLKKAQEKSVEFYARSTQKKTDDKDDKQDKETESLPPDSARDRNSADGNQTGHVEDFLLVGDPPAGDPLKVQAAKAPAQIDTTGRRKKASSKIGKAQTDTSPPGVQKRIGKARKIKDGSGSASEATKSAAESSDEEAMETEPSSATISQQDLQWMLRPLQDASLLQQVQYIGPLTIILDKLGINHQVYQQAIETKNQSFFSSLQLHDGGGDFDQQSVLPEFGQAQEG